jgi:hypothetical protein
MEQAANTKHQVHNLIILDESGSMDDIRETIVSGFNEVIQTIKGCSDQFPEQEHFVSVISFNALGIKTMFFNEPVDKLPVIDMDKYRPDAMTPLFDAMGHGINRLRAILTDKTDCNVLVTVLTDGLENASKEFSGNDIKRLVNELKMERWTFTYIGTDHDVERVADSIAIDTVMRFGKDPAAMSAMFDKERKARFMYAKKMAMKQDVSTDFYKDDEPELPQPPAPPAPPTPPTPPSAPVDSRPWWRRILG